MQVLYVNKAQTNGECCIPLIHRGKLNSPAHIALSTPSVLWIEVERGALCSSSPNCPMYIWVKQAIQAYPAHNCLTCLSMSKQNELIVIEIVRACVAYPISKRDRARKREGNE